MLLRIISSVSLILAISGIGNVHCIGYCKPESTSGKTVPAIADTFQAKLEMKDLVRNMTTEIQMWNDFDAKMARLNIVQESNEFDLFYSFNTQEIYFVQSRSLQCMVFNMSKGGDLDIIIGKNVSGIIIPEDAMTLFRLNSELGIKYMGSNYSVRGVPAERWWSCQSWPERNAEFEANWYFSQPGWDSVAQRPVPLRIEVTGISNQSATPNRPFQMVYDFVFFRPYLQESERIFQTPRGTYCDRRVKTKKLPKLSPVMIFTWEVVNGRRDLVTSVNYGRMTYDSRQQIIKFEYREPASLMKPPFYNLGSMTIVQDFKSGVAYFIDDVYGNCTAKPIGSELFELDDLEPNQKPGWHLLIMRNPNDVFQFDDNYQYEGKAMVRGLPVDVFISLRQIKVADQLMNVTFEYYILDESVTEIAIGGSGKIGKGHSIPVELRVVSYTELGPDADPTFSYYERFNFFNFDAPDFASDRDANLELAQPYYFDIGACYMEEDKIKFMMTFKPQGDSTVTRDAVNETNFFIREVIDQINTAEMGLVNAIRYQNPKVDYDEKSVYFLTTLLDKPDVYSQFVRITAQNPTILSIDGNLQFATEKDCVEACYSGNSCRSLAFCSGPNLPNSMNCLLSAQYGFKKNDAAYTCSVFISPTNSSSSLTEWKLEDAWNYISLAVSNRQINVTTGQNATLKQHSFLATAVERYVIRPDEYNSIRGKHLNRFDVIKQRTFDFKDQSKFKNRQLLNKISGDECAKACLDEFSFDCQSAVYCYDIGSCHLTEEVPLDGEKNLLGRARCNVYKKNPLSKFTEYPGQSQIFVKGKNPTGSVTSASQCAVLCENNGNTTMNDELNDKCRGFDVCKINGENLCYLDQGHITDSGNVGANRTECSHFAQTFEADFAKSGSIIAPRITHLSVVSDVTQSVCARICTEDIGSDCMAFYYCNSSAECAIRRVGDAAAVQGVGDGTCDYFKRLYNPDGSIYRITQPQAGGERFKGLSVAVAVMLYIVAVVIGVVIGSVVVVAVLNSRGNSVWRDMKAFVTRR